MALKPPDNNPGRDQLPRSLFPKKIVALRDYSAAELNELAAQPQTILPLPDNVSEAKRRQLSGLAQYRGRSPEGNKRSLGNLPRPQKTEMLMDTDSPPTLAPGAPVPTIPTAVPQVPAMKTLTKRHARRAMSKEEFDLFMETWNEWYTAHPEWTLPEDQDDVQTICLETVFMFRLKAAEADKPNVDVTEAYNQAFKRKQRARENLTARRVDQVGTKANGGSSTFNVAILSGEVTPELIQKRKQRLLQDKKDEVDFLEGTIVTPQQAIEQAAEDEK